jgi:hypothetical protein
MRRFRMPCWCSLCIACILGVLLTACNATQRGSRDEPQVAPSSTATVEPPQTAPPPAPAVAPPTPESVAGPPASTGAAATLDASAQSAAKTNQPVTEPAEPSAPGALASKAPAASAAKPASAPPLDLKALETRLKDTNAIGVYTKLTLKNQVDDLLDAFRAYYKGGAKSTLAELRRAFDLLVLKVIALLQDADPPLASAIAASREAIWGILSDPVKFATV